MIASRADPPQGGRARSAGQAVARALARLGFDEVKNARIGTTSVELDVDGRRRSSRRCASELLANPVIEDYEIAVWSPARRRLR